MFGCLAHSGGSAGATALIELALTGGDGTFAGDYTNEVHGDTLRNAKIVQTVSNVSRNKENHPNDFKLLT